MSVDVSNFRWPGIHDNVRSEVERLASEGVNARIVSPSLEGHYFLDRDRQAQVEYAIGEWSKTKGFSEQLFSELSPGARAWAGLSKRAIALHAFYNTGEIDAPADGIDFECLDWPLFDGRSARELTIADSSSEESAMRILKKYEDFFAGHSLRTGQDRYGVTAHDYIAGSLDRIADITRANVVTDIIVKHAVENKRQNLDSGVVIASLGSGLAEPDMWAAKKLIDNGISVEQLLEFDNDPIAMAAALSRAKAHGLEDFVARHRKNFLKKPIGNYVEPGSVDYANLVGLIEYIPRKVAGYKMAANLLRQVAQIMRPGGLIIFGNMVEDRAQQEWFEGIWPTLHQRTISEVLSIIDEAGYKKEDVAVEITEGEGLYAIYTIRIPKTGEIPAPIGFVQEKLGRFVTRNMPEY